LPWERIFRWGIGIGALAALSRCSGLIREISIAYYLGLGGTLDLFYLASAIPMFLSSMGGTAANQAIVPLFIKSSEKESMEHAWRVASGLLWFCALVTGIVATCVFLFAPLVWRVSGGTADQFTHGPAKGLLLLTIPVIFLEPIVGWQSGILQSRKRFFLPAAVPIAYNAAIILLLNTGTPRWGIFAFALGILLAELTRIIVQIPSLRALGLSLTHLRHPDFRAARTALAHLLPIAVAAGLHRILFMTDKIMAGSLPVGSVSAISYGLRLWVLPYSLLYAALATPLYSLFSDCAAKEDREKLRSWLVGGLRLMIGLSVPVAIGMAFLRVPLVRILYERGAFDAKATQVASGAIGAYALTLVCFSCLQLLSQCYYALGRARTPLLAGLAGAALNVVLNLLFARWWSHAGIALATGVSLGVASLLLLPGLARSVGSLRRDVVAITLRLVVPSLAMVGLILCGLKVAALLDLPRGFRGACVQLALPGALGTLGYFALWRFWKQ